jgi:hypothetical protein
MVGKCQAWVYAGWLDGWMKGQLFGSNMMLRDVLAGLQNQQ